MKKSISKRIRVTRTGKVIRRPMGISHFRAKNSAKENQRKRKTMTLKIADVRPLTKHLYQQ